MDTMEPHGRGMTADTAEQRIKRAELALQRTEEMLAEKIRTAVEAADRLVKIDPPSFEGRRAG
ncbi:hypothetical protein [Mesorhizobium sp.]|uniref:hypothetical protein n=1 Tax=Mesorhizobium sp. TaxID=1871066 RepID=UPI000FE806FE|nr:hypothetical protein [Mesorhizobium sp.]RWN24057.1 MAG: hypothetical protein EOR95_34850 [Mesorhizobium sp.]